MNALRVASDDMYNDTYQQNDSVAGGTSPVCFIMLTSLVRWPELFRGVAESEEGTQNLTP